jgi:RND superfamily putative drug exporter
VLAQGIAKRDIAKAEMIALPIALLLTLIFFRSVIAAMLPIVIGGFAVASCAALMRFGVKYTEIAVFALNISAFLGLGLAIDYALLMVQRFREELAGGATPREATAIMLDTAGRAVWVSGLAVVVSLSVLLGIPIPILRSIALGGVLAVITAFAGGMLVLPAVLAWLGPNVNRFSIGRSSAAAPPSPIWRKLGTLSMRHPIWVSVSCATALLAFASPVLRMRSAVPDTRMFAVQSEVRRVDTALGDANRFDPGGASAIQLVVSMEQGTPLDPDNLRRLRDYGARIRALDGVVNLRSAVRELDPDRMTPEEIESQKRREPTATELRRTVNENTILLVAGGKHPWRSIQAADVVEQVRAIPHPGLRVKVGGPSAQMLDLRATLSSYGRVAAVAVLAWSFLVLLVSFRSLFVPAKAVVMNILSLGASYGLLVWVFQDGHLSSVIGFEPLDAIDPTIPLVLFTIVFGLSMDYEVFLLSRIQEEWLRSGDNRESVIYGIANTGRIITSAALILVVVIGAFAAGDLVYVKQVGVGMTAAIVLDATLVRGLLVPATMQLMGHWNWWAPRWLQRKPTA